jgi:2-keto-4-pentenoate hydratase/2-oxohepta-3-ene-1,7-dioic acid hydratase in catechol pathway
MRLANINGRAALVTAAPHHAVDIADASDGRFGPSPQSVYDDWDTFVTWASSAALDNGVPVDLAELGPPVPAPSQIFAIGLNYRDHAAESGLAVPDTPTTLFTKWVSCLSGPVSQVELPRGGHTDWEVELVLVIGRPAHSVSAMHAWHHVAGVMVGQDISERKLQQAGPAPQFSLAKSLPGFGPTGPWVITTDELENPDDLLLECTLNGKTMQHGRTSDLVYSVPQLVSSLSDLVPLAPGDLIFTGTPAGVGLGRTPPHWIQDGDLLVSRIEGVGELRQTFVAAPAAN